MTPGGAGDTIVGAVAMSIGHCHVVVPARQVPRLLAVAGGTSRADYPMQSMSPSSPGMEVPGVPRVVVVLEMICTLGF